MCVGERMCIWEETHTCFSLFARTLKMCTAQWLHLCYHPIPARPRPQNSYQGSSMLGPYVTYGFFKVQKDLLILRTNQSTNSLIRFLYSVYIQIFFPSHNFTS